MPVLQAAGSSRCRHQLVGWCVLFSGMLKIYYLLSVSITKWQLSGFIRLTYFTNCVVQLKRSAKESWPRCPFFCMTIYLLTGSHTGQAALLEYDLKKCVIQHIILTWHQVITICFQIRRNTSVDWDFRPMISSSIRPKSSWMNSHNFSISQALKNSEIAINCRVTKAVILNGPRTSINSSMIIRKHTVQLRQQCNKHKHNTHTRLTAPYPGLPE